MRKSFLVAGTATLALGLASIAYAQNPAPSIESTASVSPTKAGTKSKPKAETLKLSVKNNVDSKTTAEKITITFPSTLKISTKGLDQCKASDEELIDKPSLCSKAKAGSGSARAVLNPNAPAPGPLSFKVVPYVGKNEVLFLLSGSADAVLHGKISGKKMTIVITPQLQQPVPGTYSALNDLGDDDLQEEGQELPDLVDGLQVEEAHDRRLDQLRAEPDPAGRHLRVEARRRQVLLSSI